MITGSGTVIGNIDSPLAGDIERIVPNFTSIFDSTLLSIGFQDFMYMFYDNIKLVKHIMDIILEVQARAMEAIYKE